MLKISMYLCICTCINAYPPSRATRVVGGVQPPAPVGRPGSWAAGSTPPPEDAMVVSTIKLRGGNAARGVQMLGALRKQASKALMLATSSIYQHL